MTIDKAKFICDHTDPVDRPINGYYDENEDITHAPEVTKDNLLFEQFSEFQMIHNGI